MVEWRALTKRRSERSRDYAKRKVNLNKRGQSGGRWRRWLPAANAWSMQIRPESQLCFCRELTLRIYILLRLPLSLSPTLSALLLASGHPLLSLAQSRAFCPARNVHQLFVRPSTSK